MNHSTATVAVQGTLYNDNNTFALLVTKPFNFTSASPEVTLETLAGGTFDAEIPDGRYEGDLYIAPVVERDEMDILGWLSEQAITCDAIVTVRGGQVTEIIHFEINVDNIDLNMDAWSADVETARQMSRSGQTEAAIAMWENRHGDLR